MRLFKSPLTHQSTDTSTINAGEHPVVTVNETESAFPVTIKRSGLAIKVSVGDTHFSLSPHHIPSNLGYMLNNLQYRLYSIPLAYLFGLTMLAQIAQAAKGRSDLTLRLDLKRVDWSWYAYDYNCRIDLTQGQANDFIDTPMIIDTIESKIFGETPFSKRFLPGAYACDILQQIDYNAIVSEYKTLFTNASYEQSFGYFTRTIIENVTLGYISCTNDRYYWPYLVPQQKLDCLVQLVEDVIASMAPFYDSRHEGNAVLLTALTYIGTVMLLCSLFACVQPLVKRAIVERQQAKAAARNREDDLEGASMHLLAQPTTSYAAIPLSPQTPTAPSKATRAQLLWDRAATALGQQPSTVFAQSSASVAVRSASLVEAHDVESAIGDSPRPAVQIQPLQASKLR